MAPITRADIEKRLKALEADRQAHESQINAIMGAIQDCEFWLDELDAPENPRAAPTLVEPK